MPSPPASPRPHDDAFWRERFLLRARLLSWLRLAVLVLGAAALAMPAGPPTLGITRAEGLLALAAMGAWTVAARLGPTPALVFATLCLDAALLAALLARTGGLYSPLVALQPLLAGAFALLFRSRPAPLPALAPLLLVARGGGLDLVLLGFHLATNAAAILGLQAVARREAADHRERLRLEARLRREAVHEERARLSREVHDGLGSSLATLVLQAELALARAPAGGGGALAGLKAGTEEAMEELRRSLRLLRGDFDLVRALEERCLALEARAGVRASLRCEGAPFPLPAETQLGIFRVVQEAVSNALRHGRARAIELSLRFSAEGCAIAVRDDGAGFDPLAPRPAGHYGLRGLEERAARLGGRLRLESAPGAGASVELRLPRPRDGEEERCAYS